MLPYILLLFSSGGPMVATIPQQSAAMCERNGNMYTAGKDPIAWKYRCIPTGMMEDVR